MLNKLTRSAIISTIAFGLLMALNELALAQARCVVNGREVPCEEVGRQAAKYFSLGIIGFLLFFAFGIWAFVFWLLMIIHAAKHDIDNKAMWIIVMVLTGIVGALVYYFAVKRKFGKQPPAPAAPSTLQ